MLLGDPNGQVQWQPRCWSSVQADQSLDPGARQTWVQHLTHPPMRVFIQQMFVGYHSHSEHYTVQNQPWESIYT